MVTMAKLSWQSDHVRVWDELVYAGWSWRITRVSNNLVYGVGLDVPAESDNHERCLFQVLYAGKPLDRTGQWDKGGV